MYLGPPCYGYALNCHLVYLAIPGTRSLCMKKQNFFCFIYMQSQKVKFKYVQINMKQVSYIRQISRLYAFDSVLCFLYIKHIKLRAGSVLAHKQ